MAIAYSRWERRDGADRNDLALAALQFCRRWRTVSGVDSAKYFWVDASTITILVDGEAGSLNVPRFNEDADNARAAFDLDDLCRLTAFETWAEARAGQETHERAGSPTGAR